MPPPVPSAHLQSGVVTERIAPPPTEAPNGIYGFKKPGGLRRDALAGEKITRMSAPWILILLNIAGKFAAVALGFTAPGTALCLWFVPDALLAYHIFILRAQGLAHAHRRFSTTEREVWLTIDDGPDPHDTPQILELLRSHNARATFFVIGDKVAAHPALVRAMLAAGHEVAHHTQTHPLTSFWCARPSRLHRELDEGMAVLGAVGARSTRFRPPAGIKNLWLRPALVERGLVCIGWSARGRESWRADVDTVVRRVTRDLAPGAILLLHEGPGVPTELRVHAIGRTLERLQELGYRCVVPSTAQLMGPALAAPCTLSHPAPEARAPSTTPATASSATC